MNLKEAFRYETYIDKLIDRVPRYLSDSERVFKTTRLHKKSLANPEAVDVVEESEPLVFPYLNDDIIRFAVWLINEKEKLMLAVGKAKAECGMDIDAAIGTNKLRQMVFSSIRSMLDFKASKTTTRDSDYKFNVEGNQVSYYYEVEVDKKENFNREEDKSIMRGLITKADEVSAEIDSAIVNTKVDYEPLFDVNESFEDAAEVFFNSEVA